MSERQTPRTDSAIMEIPSKFDSICVVPAELAIDLERELGDALRERDEARERERVAWNAFDEERQRASREGERVLEAIRQRDETRDTLRLYRQQIVMESSWSLGNSAEQERKLMAELNDSMKEIVGWENKLKAAQKKEAAK
jgi:hypothetical protein